MTVKRGDRVQLKSSRVGAGGGVHGLIVDDPSPLTSIIWVQWDDGRWKLEIISELEVIPDNPPESA